VQAAVPAAAMPHGLCLRRPLPCRRCACRCCHSPGTAAAATHKAASLLHTGQVGDLGAAVVAGAAAGGGSRAPAVAATATAAMVPASSHSATSLSLAGQVGEVGAAVVAGGALGCPAAALVPL